jgi:hypothetical protein
MNHKRILYKCTTILLTIATELSGAVNAESFSLNSVKSIPESFFLPDSTSFFTRNYYSLYPI